MMNSMYIIKYLKCFCFHVTVEATTTTSATTTDFVPAFSVTTPRSAVFVRKPSSRPGVPSLNKNEDTNNVRVVTSKSIVTSRPISLGKNPPFFDEFRGEPRENEGDKHIVIGKPIIGDYHSNATDAVNEIEEPPKVRIK